jgi:hypothetical protein
MHIEILVEDSSGRRLLEHLMPKLIGPYASPHTWRVHAYMGVGRIPPGLAARSDPSKRILLDQLPRLLRGYAQTKGIDAVVVVLDTDGRNCVDFLVELNRVAQTCGSPPDTLFRLAIEEVEAWYLGDREALRMAYPSGRYWMATRKILCAELGKLWRISSIQAVRVPSRKPAGRYLGRSSINGQTGSRR